MEIPEIYWQIVSNIYAVFSAGIIPGYFFYCFIEPFVERKRAAAWTGITYAAVMPSLYFSQMVYSNFRAYASGVLAAFFVMCVLDYRNLAQKLILSIIFFLVRGAAMGVSGFLSSSIAEFLINYPPAASADMIWQLILFIFTCLMRLAGSAVFLWAAFWLVQREYVNKEENLKKRELLLLLIPLLPILAGYSGWGLVVDIYEADTKKAIWDVYPIYYWLRAGYDMLSFLVVFVMLIIYQQIKKRQAEERQAELLYGQVENMKRHISEVERLYGSIRSLKHDMGNHIMTLEQLYKNKEYDVAGKYAVKLQEEFQKAEWEVKSGNPVTDVILTEKKREAEEKGIAFTSEFHFPEGADVNAFDMSVILNNALANAIEAAQKARKPYISLSSCRQKNVYMIEIKNSFCGTLLFNKESNLPFTTKADRHRHGIGLASIQKIAQKYLGGIDIRQEGDVFFLNIMLLLGQKKGVS